MIVETASDNLKTDKNNTFTQNRCLIELERGFVVEIDTYDLTNLEVYEYDAKQQLIPCDKEKLELVDLEELFEKAQKHLNESAERTPKKPFGSADFENNEDHQEHRDLVNNDNREKTIGDVVSLIIKDRSSSTTKALDFLVTLSVESGLQVLEQGRPLTINTVTSALYMAMEVGIDNAIVEIPTPGGLLLKKRLRDCTIHRDSIRDALSNFGSVDGLPSWPGIEKDAQLRGRAGGKKSSPLDKKAFERVCEMADTLYSERYNDRLTRKGYRSEIRRRLTHEESRRPQNHKKGVPSVNSINDYLCAWNIANDLVLGGIRPFALSESTKTLLVAILLKRKETGRWEWK